MLRIAFALIAITFSLVPSSAFSNGDVIRQMGGACGETSTKVYACASGLACTNGTCQSAGYYDAFDKACFAEMRKRGHDTSGLTALPARREGYCFYRGKAPKFEQLLDQDPERIDFSELILIFNIRKNSPHHNVLHWLYNNHSLTRETILENLEAADDSNIDSYMKEHTNIKTKDNARAAMASEFQSSEAALTAALEEEIKETESIYNKDEDEEFNEDEMKILDKHEAKIENLRRASAQAEKKLTTVVTPQTEKRLDEYLTYLSLSAKEYFKKLEASCKDNDTNCVKMDDL